MIIAKDGTPLRQQGPNRLVGAGGDWAITGKYIVDNATDIGETVSVRSHRAKNSPQSRETTRVELDIYESGVQEAPPQQPIDNESVAPAVHKDDDFVGGVEVSVDQESVIAEFVKRPRRYVDDDDPLYGKEH